MITIRRVEKSLEECHKVADFLVNNFIPEHQMGSLSACEFNFDKGMMWIIRHVDCATWVAKDETGKIVGSIGLGKTTPWYSEKPYLSDGWLYVLPEHRKSYIGSSLIKLAKEFAQEQQLPLMISLFNIDDVTNKIAAFQKMGLTLVGGMFMAGE